MRQSSGFHAGNITRSIQRHRKRDLYAGVLDYERISRMSVLAGAVEARVNTSEALFTGGLRFIDPPSRSEEKPAAPSGIE
jgi:hypothetical protein